jgi:hypothetical protein
MGSSLSDIGRISLEGKGPRTQGETRVTCHPGKKNTGIEPHPAHTFPTAERFVVVASCTKQEEEEEEKERGRVSKQLSMDEVDAGRDRATPASVRHDDDEPLIPISQEEEEADCRGSSSASLSSSCSSSCNPCALLFDEAARRNAHLRWFGSLIT